MHKPLLGEKLAVLVANGFCENDLTALQRALQKTGANIRIISMDQGLVNSWNGTGWGLHYASDNTLNSALAADYSMLVIPGGQRSIEKLKLTAHTKRFIGGFLDARKPVVIFDEALDLLVFCGKAGDRAVTGPENLKAAAQEAGAEWREAPYVAENNLMTGGAARGPREDYVAAACDFLMSFYNLDEVAA